MEGRRGTHLGVRARFHHRTRAAFCGRCGDCAALDARCVVRARHLVDAHCPDASHTPQTDESAVMHLDTDSGLGRALSKFRPLCGKRIALLDANGLSVARLAALREVFELAGAEVVLVAPTSQLRSTADAEPISADVRVHDTAAE